ncbi:MAG: hypothetical protein ABIH99_02460 [Candidatus Micrarchaeota archaeon]
MAPIPFLHKAQFKRKDSNIPLANRPSKLPFREKYPVIFHPLTSPFFATRYMLRKSMRTMTTHYIITGVITGAAALAIILPIFSSLTEPPTSFFKKFAVQGLINEEQVLLPEDFQKLKATSSPYSNFLFIKIPKEHKKFAVLQEQQNSHEQELLHQMLEKTVKSEVIFENKPINEVKPEEVQKILPTDLVSDTLPHALGSHLGIASIFMFFRIILTILAFPLSAGAGFQASLLLKRIKEKLQRA